MATFVNIFDVINLPNQGAGFYVPDFVVNPCFTVFLRSNRVMNTIGSRLAFSFYVQAHVLSAADFPYVNHANDGTVNDVLAGANVCYASGNAGADLHNIAINNDLAHNYEGVTGNHARELFHLINNCRRWMLELTTAEAHKHINQQNIINYFRQFEVDTDVPQIFINIIRHIARTKRGDLMTDLSRAMMNQSIWGKYRVSLTSLGSCFSTFTGCYGAIVVHRVIANHVALNALIAEPWNLPLANTITRSDISIIAMGLEIAGVFPRGWISGEKELRAMNMATRSKLMALFRRVITLSSNTQTIENAATIDAALVAAGY